VVNETKAARLHDQFPTRSSIAFCLVLFGKNFCALENRSRMKISLIFMGVGAAIGGVILLVIFFAIDPKQFDAWIRMRKPYELVLVAIAIPLTTLLHELGHLIVGLRAGMSFQAFYVKPLLIENAGGMRVRLVWRSQVGGFVRLAPPELLLKKWVRAAYIAGGPIANFAAGIFLLPTLTLENRADSVHLAALCLCVFSLVAGMVSIVPVRYPNGSASDSLRLYELLRPKCGAAP
jgi:hypothetical protein